MKVLEVNCPNAKGSLVNGEKAGTFVNYFERIITSQEGVEYKLLHNRSQLADNP